MIYEAGTKKEIENTTDYWLLIVRNSKTKELVCARLCDTKEDCHRLSTYYLLTLPSRRKKWLVWDEDIHYDLEMIPPHGDDSYVFMDSDDVKPFEFVS